jgi:hypothetical protein
MKKLSEIKGTVKDTISNYEVIDPPKMAQVAKPANIGGRGGKNYNGISTTREEVEMDEETKQRRASVAGDKVSRLDFRSRTSDIVKANHAKLYKKLLKTNPEKAEKFKAHYAVAEEVERVDEAHDDFGDTSVDKMNHHLDAVLANKFKNAELIIDALRAIVERFSINLPPIHASEVVDNHVAFHITNLHGEDCYLYLTINRDHQGYYEGYAQCVDEHELSLLVNMGHHFSDENEEIPEYPSHFILQARHSADD